VKVFAQKQEGRPARGHVGRARRRRWIARDIIYLGALVTFVVMCCGFIGVTGNGSPKDTWDKVDIVIKAIAGIAGVLVPAVIAWGIQVYNKRQHQIETARQASEFRLRQLDVAREFLPQFLSKDTDEKWAALRLIRILGDEEMSQKIAKWLMLGYWREQDRPLIERLKNDEDPDIAALAQQAFRSISSPPTEILQVSLGELGADYKVRTTATISPVGRIVFTDNATERYGQWVVTRGDHTLVLPAKFRMGIYPVTNEFFRDFVNDNGYEVKSYWSEARPGAREKCLSQDGRTLGPSTWPSSDGCLPGREHHPVAGIGYHEAVAFCNWLQTKHPPSEQGWKWLLPTEDMWEFSARTQEGLTYPWGNTFKPNCCNSAEEGNRTTTDVSRYPDGASHYSCYDTAGNVWELVVAEEQETWSCVLKGGSFRNTKDEVKSYLRLFGVPRDHRPPDFGFRCSQVYA
jgi:formylglycine-generating enzyme required for sulfatase activity